MFLQPHEVGKDMQVSILYKIRSYNSDSIVSKYFFQQSIFKNCVLQIVIKRIKCILPPTLSLC